MLPSREQHGNSDKFQALKHIFTSPSSANEEMDLPLVPEGQGKRHCGERRTHDHVARRIGMTKVVPRAIAYVCSSTGESSSDYSPVNLTGQHVATVCPLDLWLVEAPRRFV